MLQGRGLSKKAGSGTRNVYAEVSLGNRAYQTPVAWRTLNPSWEASFVLYGKLRALRSVELRGTAVSIGYS